MDGFLAHWLIQALQGKTQEQFYSQYTLYELISALGS